MKRIFLTDETTQYLLPVAVMPMAIKNRLVFSYSKSKEYSPTDKNAINVTSCCDIPGSAVIVHDNLLHGGPLFRHWPEGSPFHFGGYTHLPVFNDLVHNTKAF